MMDEREFQVMKDIEKGIRGLVYVQAMALPISWAEIEAQIRAQKKPFSELGYRIARANRIVEECMK